MATSDAVVPTKARKNPSMNPEKERSNIHHNPTESADRVRANSISFAKLIFWRAGVKDMHHAVYSPCRLQSKGMLYCQGVRLRAITEY